MEYKINVVADAITLRSKAIDKKLPENHRLCNQNSKLASLLT